MIAPWIQKRTIALPPALTMLSQTVLGILFGLIGLIVATPFIAVLLVVVRRIYVEWFLERKSGATVGERLRSAVQNKVCTLPYSLYPDVP